MHAVRYGDRGPPLVYLPTSAGDHTEFEQYALPDDCASWIDEGRVQFFSLDAMGPRGLFDDSLPPRERIGRYAAFESYAIDEALPWVRSLAGSGDLGVVGASYGAFAAANLYLKCPGTVRVACGLGGVYSMDHRLTGQVADDARRHAPLVYLPAMEDEATLAALRSTRGFHLFGAENDLWLESTYRFAGALAARRIPHRLDLWPAPADHHESWWKRQIRVFLDRCY